MDVEFINEYKILKKNNDFASKTIASKFSNKELDEETYNKALNNINNNILFFCKNHLNSCSEFLKEKLNLEINLYTQINEFDVSLKEIKTIAIKNFSEFEKDIKNFNYQLNNHFLNDEERRDLVFAFEIMQIFHSEALKCAPKRQDYDKIKTEIELSNNKKNKPQKNIDKEEPDLKEKPSFFYKFLPLITFFIISLILYIISFFNNK